MSKNNSKKRFEELGPAVAVLFNEFRALNELIDEGYLNGNDGSITVKADLDAVNDFLADDDTQDKPRFESEEAIMDWIQGVANQCSEFGKNYGTT